jgi:hypothetical protein
MLEHPEELHKGKYEKPQTRGAFFSDRREEIEGCLEYLAFVVPRLPEKQRGRTLTREKLQPLIRALLSYEPRQGSWLKNERAFQVALMLMDEAENTAFNIIPSEQLNMIISADTQKFDASRDLRARAIHTFASFLQLEEMTKNQREQPKSK